jgi:ATP-dependent helicase/nuclease subunit A
LYVACTRARHHLGLYANLKTGNDGEIRPPGSRTFLSLLWPVLENDFIDNLHVVEDVETEADQNDQPDWMQRTSTNWQPPTIPDKLQDIVSTSSPSKNNTESIEFSWASETLRISGIAIHRLVEQIHSNWSQWKAADSQSQLAQSHAVLVESGLSGIQLVQARENVLSALNNLKSDPRADWVFSSTHNRIRTEWPLSAAIDNQNLNIIIDRSFVDETGARWIIDFKSSRHQDENLGQFLEHEKQRYFQTMNNYAKVVALTGPEPIKLGLYFPLLKAWIEWDGGNQT